MVIKLSDEVYNGDKEDEEYELFRFLNTIMYPHKDDFMTTMSEYIDYSDNEELWKEVVDVSTIEQIKYEGLREKLVEEITGELVEKVTEEVTQKVTKEVTEKVREDGMNLKESCTTCPAGMLKENREMTEKKNEERLAGVFAEEYCLQDQELSKRFEFRNICSGEAEEAARIESICFPPNEACSREMMCKRAARAPELFLVAMDKSTGRMAGFLNGLSTDESSFRDEFFTDAQLYEPEGKNVMLLGLDVLPEYRGQGLARELMYCYLRREYKKGRQMVLLTCLESKVLMYQKMGFWDLGIADSAWGGEQWHEMRCILHA